MTTFNHTRPVLHFPTASTYHDATARDGDVSAFTVHSVNDRPFASHQFHEKRHFGTTGRTDGVIIVDIEREMEVTPMAEKANRQIKTYVKPSQESAFEAARGKAKHNKAEALREAMRMYCEYYGVDFDPTVSERGGWQGNDASKEALREHRNVKDS